MKVLYWLEPFYELGSPYVMQAWLPRFQRMHEQLKAFAGEYEGRLLTWEGYEYRLQGHFLDEKIVLTQSELRLHWQATGNLHQRLEWNRAPRVELDAVRELIRATVGGFEPDIVLLLSASDWLQAVFPDALLLHAEATWLYAPPHLDLWQLDPAGFGKGRALADHRREWLDGMAWDEDKSRFCERMRRFTASLWQANGTLRALVADIRTRFERLILVPLGDPAPSDGETPVMSVLDWYLQRMRPTDAFLVTHHPNAPALNRAQTLYLTAKYPNFLTHGEFKTGELFPLVDAVLGDFTSASSQALIFGKPVISLGDDCPFAGERFRARSPLCRWLEHAGAQERDRMLYWLLTRYSIPTERLTSGLWLSRFLERALAAFRAGAAWRVFDVPIIDQAEWEARPWFVEGLARDEPVSDPAAVAEAAKRESHRARYGEAEAAIEAGEQERAVDILRALVEEQTPLWEPYNDLAAMAAGEGDWLQAQALLRLALKADPDARQARLNLVAVESARGDFEAALAELGPLMRKEPTNPEVFNLARDIVGQAPALSPLAWIRFVADIRAPRLAS